MKAPTVLFLLAAMVAACYPKGDALNASPVEGTVVITDTFTRASTLVAHKAAVYLVQEGGAADQYYDSTITNTDGNFSFSHRPKDISLCVQAKFTKNDLKYVSEPVGVHVLKDSVLKLMPQYPRGKLKLIVKDANTYPVNGMDVYLFKNRNFATSINSTQVTGEIKKTVTTDQGIAFFYDLEEGEYYVAGKKDKLLFEPDTMNVNNDNFKNPKKRLNGKDLDYKIVMATVPPSSPIQLYVKVTDIRSDPLTGIEIYLFSSQIQANSLVTLPDSIKPKNAAAFKKTNSNGLTSFIGLQIGQKYYVAVRDSSRTFRPNVKVDSKAWTIKNPADTVPISLP